MDEENDEEVLYCRLEALQRWVISIVYKVDKELKVSDLYFSFKNGIAMAAFLSHFVPEKINYQACRNMELDERIAIIVNVLNEISVPVFSMFDYKKKAEQFSFSLVWWNLYKKYYKKKELVWQGYLRKWGGKKDYKMWNERWFVQNGDQLSYYVNKGDEVAKGALLLSNLTDIRLLNTLQIPSNTIEIDKHQPLLIQLITPTRSWLVYNEERRKTNLWVATIRNAAQKLKLIPVPNEKYWDIVAMAGPLLKREPGTLWGLNWNRKYCDLDFDRIDILSSKDGDLLDYIHLKSIVSVAESTAVPTEFTIETPSQKHLFRAKKQDERAQWLRTLHQNMLFVQEPLIQPFEKKGVVAIRQFDDGILRNHFCIVSHSWIFQFPDEKEENDLTKSIKHPLPFATLQMHDLEAKRPHGMVIKIIGQRTMDLYASSLEEKLEWGAVIKSQIQNIDCEFEKILFWNDKEKYMKDKHTEEVSSELDTTVEETKIPEGKQEVESSIEMREISIVYSEDRAQELKEAKDKRESLESKVEETKSENELTQEQPEIEIIEVKDPPQEGTEEIFEDKEQLDVTVTIQD